MGSQKRAGEAVIRRGAVRIPFYLFAIELSGVFVARSVQLMLSLRERTAGRFNGCGCAAKE